VVSQRDSSWICAWKNPHGVFLWTGNGVARAAGEGDAEEGAGVGLTEAEGEEALGAVAGPGCVPGGAGGGLMAAAG